MIYESFKLIDRRSNNFAYISQDQQLNKSLYQYISTLRNVPV